MKKNVLMGIKWLYFNIISILKSLIKIEKGEFMSNENELILTSSPKIDKSDLSERKDESKRQWIRTRFSEWLKMENICVFTGAGTSISSDGLSLWELGEKLMKLLDEYYKQKDDDDYQKMYKLLFEEMKENKDFSELEKLLSDINALYNLLDSDSSKYISLNTEEIEDPKSTLSEVLNDVQKFFFLLCTLELDFNINSSEVEDSITPHHSFLSKLISRDTSLGRVKLFTLNYDTLFEQALDDLGISYADGFKGHVNRKFDPSCYDIDYYYPGRVTEGKVKRYDRYMHLYKLHGSINWRESEEPGKSVKYSPVNINKVCELRDEMIDESEDAEDEITINNGFMDKIENEFSKDEVLGILPTSRKTRETLNMPYSHLFRAFHESLQKPQTFLLIIGYGFNDNHVNQVIEDALSNPSLIVCIVDPFAIENGNIDNDIIEKYLSLEQKGRIFLLSEKRNSKGELKTGFSNFAEDILPDVRMLEQWVKLRKLEKNIKKKKEEND